MHHVVVAVDGRMIEFVHRLDEIREFVKCLALGVLVVRVAIEVA